MAYCKVGNFKCLSIYVHCTTSHFHSLGKDHYWLGFPPKRTFFGESRKFFNAAHGIDKTVSHGNCLFPVWFHMYHKQTYPLTYFWQTATHALLRELYPFYRRREGHKMNVYRVFNIKSSIPLLCSVERMWHFQAFTTMSAMNMACLRSTGNICPLLWFLASIYYSCNNH